MFNLRTRLFLAWSILTLLLWGGVYAVVQGTIESSFARSARQSFVRTKLALDSLQQEQSRRMRQAALLVMQVPELRALIAEWSYELQSSHSSSLQERLDSLADVVDVRFVCALDANATLIGRSDGAPWRDASDFDGFVRSFEPARQLLRSVFGGTDQPAPSRGAEALWPFENELNQVVVVPLIFQEDSEGEAVPVEGALIIGSPFTDQLAAGLGRSHDCEISFVIDRTIAASSLGAVQRKELVDSIAMTSIDAAVPFVSTLAEDSYLTLYEPITDRASAASVGAIVIQRSLGDSRKLLDALLGRMLFIISCGLLVAGLGSFLLSTAITRPIRDLLHAVNRVAEGDLQQSLPEKDRSELGAMAIAFNQMVRQLRHRGTLERRVVEVETAARTKSEFLASMSHEIRTPMTAILGYADLLRDPEQSPSRRAECVRVIRSSGDHLMSIINDILDLSKIEAGELKVERIPCSPPVVLSDVLSLMRVRAAEKRLDLHAEIEGAIPKSIRTDPTRLRQILLNLVGNAIKFTETGSVRVVADLAEEADALAPRLRFRIIDTGIGITAEQIERLFEPFAQADATITRRFGGTGLGLSICRRLTAMLGGSITVESTPGRGSTFSFTIDTGPLDGIARVEHFDEAVESDGADDGAGAARTLRGRILLADDSTDNRKLLSLYLRAAGADVTEAENGHVACDEALRAGEPFDLILMDMQMPEMDGYTAATYLRQNGHVGPIVALTANAMAEDEARCRRCGCDGYLTKPIGREELIRAAAAYMDGARRARALAPVAGARADDRGEGDLDGSIAALRASYIDALPEKVDRLQTLLDERNLTDLAAILHSLRGSGGLFDLMAITDRAAEAETAIDEDDALGLLMARVGALVDEIRRVAGYDRAKESCRR